MLAACDSVTTMDHPIPNPEYKDSDDSLSVAMSDTECPFCDIISNYAPIAPLSASSPSSNDHFDPKKLDPPAFVLLSTKDLIAFLDIHPLTRGHVLVCPRRHVEKMGDMKASESAQASLDFNTSVLCSFTFSRSADYSH